MIEIFAEQIRKPCMCLVILKTMFKVIKKYLQTKRQKQIIYCNSQSLCIIKNKEQTRTQTQDIPHHLYTKENFQ